LTINYNFKINWKKILNFNRNFEIRDISKSLEEKFRIPLTPIEIDGKTFRYFNKLLYPKFINDQQNIVDIIVSNDEDKIIGIYFYETQMAGVHNIYRKIPNNLIIFRQNDLNNINEFFNKLQLNLIENNYPRISIVRIFKEKAIELINNHCIEIDKISIHEFFGRSMDLIQDLFEQQLFFLYPEPNIYKFIKEGLKLLNGIRIKSIYQFFNEILPEFNIAIILFSKKLSLIIKIQNIKSITGISNFDLKLIRPEDLGINLMDLTPEGILHLLRSKLEVENLYLLKQKKVILLFSDLFELKIPFIKDQLLLILQKVLFGYRSFEKNWYLVPRPKVYNSFLRFLVRIFGINLNLKKISHWAIPELFFNIFESYFGLKSKVLIILTDILKYKKLNLKNLNYLNFAFKSAIIFDIENSSIKGIIPIKKDEIFSAHEENNLESIRLKLLRNYGFISAVIILDKHLIFQSITNFIFKLSKFNPIKKYKTFKMYKKNYYFLMYPELPPYKLLKEKGIIALFKMLIPIFIDRYEF